jgi:hypothetical protein
MNEALVWVGGGNSVMDPTHAGGIKNAPGGGAGDGKLHAFDLVKGTEIPNMASVPGMAAVSSSLIAANGHIYAVSAAGKVYAVTP